jgi:hypothetical protein
MKLNEFLLAELNREVDRSRRALEQVPEGNATGSRTTGR